MAAVRTDLLLDPFDARWGDLRRAATVAEEAGFDGLWTWDHLAGGVHRAGHVLECWTVLSALAAVTERVTVGPLVLNVANRDAGTLAVMAATLQEVSGGRLVLGLGAGGGRRTPYSLEQQALGRPVPGDRARRADVERAVAVLRDVWSGKGVGFLRPIPPPPIIIGAFGPRMAELAGRVGDGINTQAFSPSLPALVRTARDAAAGREFLVTVFAGLDERWLDRHRPERRRLEQVGVDRLVLLVEPPYDPDDLRAAGRLLRR